MKKRILALILLVLCLSALFSCNKPTEIILTPDDIETKAPRTDRPTAPADTAAPEVTKSTATPLFWHVTGGKSNCDIYLLGTIHVAEENAYPLRDEILNALRDTDSLAVEADVVGFQNDFSLVTAVSNIIVYADGTTISSHIKPSVYKEAAAFLASAGTYSKNLDYYKPFVWNSYISEVIYKAAGLSGEYGIDEYLISYAYNTKKPVVEIESVLEQYAAFDSLSDDTLSYMLEGCGEEGYVADSATATLELYDAWYAGDIEQLNYILFEADFDREGITEEQLRLLDEYYNTIVHKRSLYMSDIVSQYAAEGKKTFVAVGVSHMLGEDGIVARLMADGCNVEVVKYAEER